MCHSASGSVAVKQTMTNLANRCVGARTPKRGGRLVWPRRCEDHSLESPVACVREASNSQSLLQELFRSCMRWRRRRRSARCEQRRR